jgi:glycosyltransferase involved in cell wall biosynthesis
MLEFSTNTNRCGFAMNATCDTKTMRRMDYRIFRRAAINWFMRTRGHIVLDAENVHRKLLKVLGQEAVGRASSARNQNDKAITHQQSALALSVYPEVTRTMPWLRSVCERRMGMRTLGALLPAVTRSGFKAVLFVEEKAPPSAIVMRKSAEECQSRSTYSVLIRTFNCESTLPTTLKSLQSQTVSPTEYVFVDSGSDDGTLDLVPPGSKTHGFVGSEFNYSDALNQGVAHVSTEFVLIISSHTSLGNDDAIAFGLALLRSREEIGAVSFCHEKSEALDYTLIDKDNFDGFNGLWNTCALIRVSLLRRRGFRREVFAAEDQEWANWLFCCEDKKTARISGAGMVNGNPRKASIKKRLNEYVAVAYFSNRKLLGITNICRVAYMAMKFDAQLQIEDRVFHVLLFFHLVACRVRPPRYRSRYF